MESKRLKTLPKVMLLGPSGLLGRAIMERDAPGLEIVPVPRRKLDLTDPAAIRRAVDEIRPDLILNAAACTDVEVAESQQEQALAVNARAVETLARAASHVGAALLHISTDQVFDGGLDRPYTEVDHAAPLNIYGATKLLGDELAQLACSRSAILRTSALHAPWGDNLVWHALNQAGRGREIAAATDRVISPTAARTLAEICICIAPELVESGPYADFWGVTHVAGQGMCSEVALIGEALKRSGRECSGVRPTTLADWPMAAALPKATALDCARFTRVFGLQLPPWQAQLAATVSAPAAKETPEAA